MSRMMIEAFEPDARAQLGERWPQDTTDRGVLLEVLRRKVEARRSELTTSDG